MADTKIYYSAKHYCYYAMKYKEQAQQILSQTQTTGTELDNQLKATGAAQVSSVTAEGTKQIGLVGNEGNTQIGLVTAEGIKQIGLVEDEGDTQIARVTGLVDQAAESATSAANSATAAEQSAVAARPLGIKNITNCLTSIPRDIKLELNNGTLTLKAGSKLYKGNSTFIVTKEDKSITGTNASAISFYDVENNSLEWRLLSECYSQDTAPTNTQYMLWLDTANKTVKSTTDTGATWHECALPVCTFTAGSTQITSIDQVFNGFGFICSTIFALPGVSGLIPNYRNPDGSLKNIEVTLDEVKIQNRTDWGSYLRYFWLSFDRKLISTIASNVTYDAEGNKNYNTFDNSPVGLICGEVTSVDGRITSIAPKTVFHAVDYDEFINKIEDKFQIVSAVPANPVTGTFYYIPE